VRNKPLNSSIEPPTSFCGVSAHRVSACFAIFCQLIAQPSKRNQQKTNRLQNSSKISCDESGANSLFQNILRISPLTSRFCGDYRRYAGTNINGMNILQKCEEKMWGWGVHLRNEKGGPREAAFLTAWPEHRTQSINPQNDMNDTNEAREPTDHRT
jgi:hypothetical protein